MAAYPITTTQAAATQTSLWRDVGVILVGAAVGVLGFMAYRRWI